MKKILIATTALVATAGVAAAEVKLSGYARFGVQWTEGTAATAGVAGALTLAEARAYLTNHAAVINPILGVGVTGAANLDTAANRDAYAAYVAGLTLAGAQTAANTVGTALGGAAIVDALAIGTRTSVATVTAGIAALNTQRQAIVDAQAIAEAAQIANGGPTAAERTANAGVARQLAAIDAALAAIAGTAAVAATADSTDVVSRARFQLDASTTTDAGVGLNVRQRIQTEENGTNDTNGARFGLTYGGFAVNMGNINGVLESTPNLYMATNSAGVGLEGNGFHSLVLNNAAGSWGWTAYSSGGAGATNGAEVIYSANGLRLHAHTTEGSTAYGASYAFGDVTVAAGHEDFDAGGSQTLLTAGMNIGNGWVAVAHGITEGGAATADVTKTAFKGGYDVAPGMNVYGFVASEDAGNASGVGMSYDLGGGASFDAGYTTTAASLGILSAGVFFTF